MRRTLPLSLILFALGCPAPEVPPDKPDASPDTTPDVTQDVSPDLPDATVDLPPDTPDPLSWSTLEPGPFAVGYRTFEHTYTPYEGGPERTITMSLWYPTDDTEGRFPRYARIFTDRGALENASILPSVYPDGLYPVHVYSHGHLGFAGSGAGMLRHFASHGWVAIAPDHKQNTLYDNVDPRPPSIYYKRGQDVSAAIDALENLPPEDPLSGKTRTDRVIMSGFSFGVHSVWSVVGATFEETLVEAGCDETDHPPGCTPEERAIFSQGLRDERIVGAVAIAGSIKTDWFGESGQDSVTTPLLTISGSEDPVGADKQYDKVTTTDIIWIDVAGACHSTFGVGSCATLEQPKGEAMFTPYTLAFARHHVLGDETPEVVGILDGSVEVDPGVTFVRKTNE